MANLGVRSGTIPYLDGLRGCSILAVLFLHLGNGRELGPWGEIAHKIIGNGQLGVNIFFVISGYLITTLLLREESKTGRISLRDFYCRRIARILPAAYLYIAVIAALTLGHILQLHARAFLATGLFVWNYSDLLHLSDGSQDAVALNHFWTLSLEEQFYLLWPSCLVFWGRRGSRTLALAVIVLVPGLRLASYVLFPASRPQLIEMFHTGVDQIIWGAWVALSFDTPRLLRWRTSPWLGRLTALLAVLVIVAAPLIATHIPGFGRFVLPSAYGGFGALLLIWLLSGQGTWIRRALQWKPLCWIGVLSYSLYIWQQIFLTPNSSGRLPLLVGVCCAFGAAIVSYYLIEAPARAKLQRLFGTGAARRPQAPATSLE
jgi:peptidoglycan/LPS O-acetylase OafA/YrhL